MRVILVVMEVPVASNYEVNAMDLGDEIPLDVDVKKLVEKLEKYMVSKSGYLLPSAIIKGKKGGYFFSVTDKRFVYMDRQAEFYVLPWKKDEQGRLYLYSPHTFKQGIIILVPEDEINILGFN